MESTKFDSKKTFFKDRRKNVYYKKAVNHFGLAISDKL